MSIDINPAAKASLERLATEQSQAEVPVLRREHAEGEIARLIEQQAAKIPSHWFLFGAIGAMGMSLAFELGGNTRIAGSSGCGRHRC